MWLERAGKGRVWIGSGVLIGRSPCCDVILGNALAGRLHAVVRPDVSGVELRAVKGRRVALNDRPVERALLTPGDRISVPGEELLVVSGGAERAVGWWIEHEADRYGITTSPFRLGGGVADHLFVHGWPASAASVRLAPGGPWLTVQVDAEMDGSPLAPGETVLLQAGSELRIGDRVVLFGQEGGGVPATESSHAGSQALAVALEFLPTGARLELTLGDRVVVLELSELRARLIAILIAPPLDYVAGEPIPDEVALPRVWPRRPGRSNHNLNGLVHRIRADLLEAGAPANLVERVAGGGATRFRLADDAPVVVHV